MATADKKSMLPLFREYPLLRERIPHVPLGNFPTPVEPLTELGEKIGVKQLFIKRDDLSGEIYGGNKVRKLEFLLGEMLARKTKSVITFGFAGSNHALATNIYAQKLGMKSISMLMAQANANYLRTNLLCSHHYQARLCHYPNLLVLSLALTGQLLRVRFEDGKFPRCIPAGGSNPLGILGYINAALELKEQIAAGTLPEPDLIYVPLGSMGTSIGLKIGVKLAGIRATIIPIRVIEEKMASPRRMLRLTKKTVSFLRENDPAIPQISLSQSDLNIRNEFIGSGYARFTEKGVAAAKLIHKTNGIVCNGAYSAKALSALLADAENGKINDRKVLFWNTYNSRDLTGISAKINFRELPPPFHRYFTEEVQELDREGK